MNNHLAEPGKMHGSFWLRALPYIALLVLAIIGVSYTDLDPAGSLVYWQLVIPFFALMCILIQVRTPSAQAPLPLPQVIITQILHWAAVWLVMRMLFVHQVQHLVDSNVTALILMYLLALACFLAGLYLNWRLCIVGLFLAVGSVAVAFIDDSGPLMAVIAVTIVVIFYVVSRFRGR